MAPSDLRRFRANAQDETDSAAIYRAMAEAEPKAEIAQVYLRLAQAEESHARFWLRRIEKLGGRAPRAAPRWRARALIWLARHLGASAVLPTVMRQETLNSALYDNQGETLGTTLPAQERAHARLLAHLSSRSRQGWDGSRYAQLEGRHGAGGGNTLRAVVLGANDGLVSTLSLIMGAAGAAFSSTALLATAVAGTLAGACSMAMGEWISVQSARELCQRQIAAEKDELETAPEEEKEELVLIYQAKGFSPEEARLIAERVFATPESALDTLAREELGVNPEDLGGSAWAAALSSFLVFLAGALVPAAPLLWLEGQPAVVGSAMAGAAGLFLIGAAITVYTGGSALKSGLRQLAIGAAAAAATYGVGRLFGVALGG
ncbi:MAG: VIT1/CCC1 transporter family protein [Rhodocyclaceae bacterium]|jgi:VIT1/CCC1 family predicted Fe2+/Mn2+ transporter|nr:VIT1/CCC1 transporter family protein [Rhodocyclaceae bacterium]